LVAFLSLTPKAILSAQVVAVVERRVFKEQQAHKERMAMLVRTAHKERQVLRVFKERTELVLMVRKAPLVLKVFRERMEHKAPLVLKVFREHKDSPDYKVFKERKV
jgi:hypothetical protein